jgi:pyruvate/2-oxoglutarate dehydrogenase complex dihydrolipoamide dehydrogenase (E3) component
VRDELVNVVTDATVTRISRTPDRLSVDATTPAGAAGWEVDLVLLVVGVRPGTTLLTEAGAGTGPHGAVLVADTLATCLPGVWAAGAAWSPPPPARPDLSRLGSPWDGSDSQPWRERPE